MRYLNPLNWVRWIFLFVGAWFLAISWRDVPKAIPALLLIFLLVIAAAIALNDNSNWRTELLNKQLVVAWEQENYETAELVIKRQLRKRPDDPELIFRLGLSREYQEKMDEAAELMRALARMNGHMEAARWLLKNEYIGKEWNTLESDQKKEFGELLALIHRQAPKDIAIKQLYADYLIASENYPKAIPILEELAFVQPMRGLQAAALSRRLGNSKAANRMAERALSEVDRMSEEDPTNGVLALAVAQNQLFLQRYADSVRTLDRAAKRVADPKMRTQLRQAIGDTIAAWIGHLEKNPGRGKADRMRILKMLQSALQYAPNNPRVLTLVADQVLATADEDDEQIAAVREALISGSSTGIAHFIRGTAALMKNDIESATMSLKLAAQHMPRSGAILNNLAVALTIQDGADLEKALRISETAI